VGHLAAWTGAFSPDDLRQWLASAGTGFALVAAAEIGDKSQLVCMSLAARHRGWPVLLGAVGAFAVLNLLAVLFGATVGAWVSPRVVAGIVAVLFAVFGIRALLTKEEDEEDDVVEKSGHGIFWNTFALIFVAEFGDRTQLSVAGLSGATEPAAVWLGATLALTLTSALAIWAGRIILRRTSAVVVHRISGILFLVLAAVAAYQALTLTPSPTG
jgi:putative Ca2+/H+ antiporter (TMEM165/GDT1 family)